MKNILLFTLFCLSWGTTWIAIKYGVLNAPPIFFAGTRFFIAGLLLLLFVYVKQQQLTIKLLKNKYLYITSFMMMSLTFGLIFWGEYFVSPSITAIIVQGLIPILLTLFAILYKLEKLTFKYSIASILGILGLYFILNISNTNIIEEYTIGILALILGTVFYTWGSIILKIKIEVKNILELSAYQNIFGGIVLVIFSFFIESDKILNFSYLLNPTVIIAWIHLVIVGSIIGFTLYLYFLDIWGAKKVSLYTFITPVVAIVIDRYILGTKLTDNEILGMTLILITILISLLPVKSKLHNKT